VAIRRYGPPYGRASATTATRSRHNAESRLRCTFNNPVLRRPLEPALCIASENTSTCADARVAATAGVFFAAIDCSSSHPSAKLTGIVPRDVTQIEAGGQTAKPDADGAVTVTVPGGKVDDIQLSNGRASQLLLTGNECGQKAQTVEARPVQ
jgi:hypothetical protein